MFEHLSRARVYTALAVGLATFGLAPILVRLAPDTSPLVLVTYRTLFAVFMLLPFWVFMRDRGAHPDKAGERWLIALAGCCLGLHFTFWISSLYYTSVASASVLVTIHPVIMIVAERVIYGRQFAATTWLGVMIAFGGSLLLGISDSRIEQEFADPLLGNTLAVMAAVIFVVYLLIGQKIRQRREWIDYVFPVYFYAGVTCLLLTVAAGKNLLDISLAGIWVGAGLAIGPQITGHGSMNYAVRYVSPTLLSTLVLAEPLIASVLAWLIFSETPPVLSITAMVIIITGIGLTWKRRAGKKQIPPETG